MTKNKNMIAVDNHFQVPSKHVHLRALACYQAHYFFFFFVLLFSQVSSSKLAKSHHSDAL